MHDVPKVRGHHLLCLLTYVGRGYTPAFVRSMDALTTHLDGGGSIEVGQGPDVLCASLIDAASPWASHCALARNAERDAIAMQHIAILSGVDCAIGTRLTTSRLNVPKMRRALQRLDRAQAVDAVRMACRGCEWLGLCRAVSTGGFVKAKLSGPTLGDNER